MQRQKRPARRKHPTRWDVELRRCEVRCTVAYENLCTLDLTLLSLLPSRNLTFIPFNSCTLIPGVQLVVQADQKQHCIQAVAFQVELPVVMATAEAILGEAEMLAVVVRCEELPHHFNSPRRLPENCKVCHTKPHCERYIRLFSLLSTMNKAVCSLIRTEAL
jgi:hypothetical protein